MRLLNIWSLFRKEMASLARDPAALVMIAFSFSIAIYTVPHDIKTDVDNAPVAMVDHDGSHFSHRLADAFQRPMFQPVKLIDGADVDQAMNEGRYIFVLDIPPNFEADLLAGRHPEVQILADATTMSQAGIGSFYVQQIVEVEAARTLNAPSLKDIAPISIRLRSLFNPNHQSFWFVAVMQITLNLTILSIILVGAAFMREREKGTLEHLLVMPVSAAEIAFAKILANSLVVLAAAVFALEVVVRRLLGVPVAGSVLLFVCCAAPYLFATAAIGVFLATLAESMPQFALLSIPVFVILSLLSGAVTPLESMPTLMRWLLEFSPTTHFVSLSEAILFRGAGLSDMWRDLLAIIAVGVVALTAALRRFSQVYARFT